MLLVVLEGVLFCEGCKRESGEDIGVGRLSKEREPSVDGGLLKLGYVVGVQWFEVANSGVSAVGVMVGVVAVNGWFGWERFVVVARVLGKIGFEAGGCWEREGRERERGDEWEREGESQWRG